MNMKPVRRFLVFIIILVFICLTINGFFDKTFDFKSRYLKQDKIFIRILAWTDFFGGRLTDQIDVQRSLEECQDKFQVICEVTHNRSLIHGSHALIFHAWSVKMNDLPGRRDLRQPWIHVGRESPPNEGTNIATNYPQITFNWTMSYRRHSDVYHPYGRTVLREQNLSLGFHERLKMLSSRPKLVAWVSSNCKPSSQRLLLVKMLKEYIPVDIYGSCGNLSCGPTKGYPESCMPQLAKKYKFFLALENSFCYEYITEKPFNALNHSVVPVVYGHGPYADKLPPNSFINVEDFNSVKELAQFILELDRDAERYSEYLKWTEEYEIKLGGGICNLCRKLADPHPADIKWHTENPNTFRNIPQNERKRKFGGLMKEIGYEDEKLKNLEELKSDCIFK